MNRFLPHLVLGFLCFVIQAVLYALSAQITWGELGDADCYMRLLRVEHLLATGQWFDQMIPHSNAPFGETSHWARPLDVLLILSALPFRLFFSMKDSLFWGGVWFSPVMQIFSMTVLAWSAAPVLKSSSRMHLGIFFLCQPALITYYMAGRPDHHSLLMFCFVIITGQMLHILTRPASTRLLAATGLMQALMLWISVEALAVSLLTQLVLGLAWLANRPGAARQNLILSLAQLCGVLVVLLAETPGLIFRVDVYDRLCGLNLAFFAAQTLFWFTVACTEKHSSILKPLHLRLPAAAAGGAACLAVIHLLSPRFFLGPYANVDPRLVHFWLSNVREVQPLATSVRFILPQTVTWLAPAFLVLPFLLIDLPKRVKETGQFWTGLYFLLGSILFILLTLLQIRWAAYAEFILVFPLALILSRLLDHLEPRLRPEWFRPLRVLLLLLFAAGYLPFVLLCNPTPCTTGTSVTASPAGHTRGSVFSSPAGYGTLNEMTAWLRQHPQFRGQTQRIVAHLDSGPEILYRSGMEVIATPYHRNASGVLFVFDLMNRTTAADAREDLLKRGVTLILLSTNPAESGFYQSAGLTNTFYDQIQSGTLPPWLSEVELPGSLKTTYRLFRVIL